MALSLDFQIVPVTDAPSQDVTITLGTQPCLIRLYTKSVNAPIEEAISTSPPVYENVNPLFLDLFVNDGLVIGGVLCLNGVRIVRDAYLGFTGDLAVIDTSGRGEDPQGVPRRLPPPDLRNFFQRTLPLRLGGKAPATIANHVPGLGTRFLLTYWPHLR